MATGAPVPADPPVAPGRRARPQSVLFMCGQNVVRSPMAAILTRHLVWTLTDPMAAFATWFRVLKPGGRLLIVDGDWVSAGPMTQALRALAGLLGSRKSSHGDSMDPDEHSRILAQVHYRKGLTVEQLAEDLTATGFVQPRRHSVQPVYLWGMRHEPWGDWLRLNASRRFALSVEKP